MVTKILRTIAGILLIPVAIGTSKSFYMVISGISPSSVILHILERGVLAYFLIHVIVFRPVYLYVLGHEFVHVLATWVCGGKIVSFSVTPSGGNVVTSKTNFFIELSPYFVPIYTIMLGPIFLLLRATGGGTLFVFIAFIFLIGMTLAFHFAMTADALKLKQPDIVKSGFIFSLVCIFVGNLVIIMAVFCPLFDNLSFVNFLKSSVSNSTEFYRITYEKILQFGSYHNIWQ